MASYGHIVDTLLLITSLPNCVCLYLCMQTTKVEVSITVTKSSGVWAAGTPHTVAQPTQNRIIHFLQHRGFMEFSLMLLPLF